MPTTPDDRPTLAALGVVAFAFANIAHEGLGHGLTALAIGGKVTLLTTCYLNASGKYSLWIPAAGGLMNVAFGLASLAVLRFRSQLAPTTRYFLILVAAFDLFFAFGYPAYSGIAHFGDWAAVFSAFKPEWLWRTLLIVVSIVGYYGTMKLLARPMAPFAHTAATPPGTPPDKARMLRITLIPYIAAMIIASLAGALNPNGWRTMLTSGLPAAAAAFGLTQMDNFIGSALMEFTPPLPRSTHWIVTGTLVLIVFIGILGPGIHFR